MTMPASSFRRKPPLGVIMLIAMVLLAVIGPLFVDFNPASVDTTSRLLAPFSFNRNGAFFLLGTDQLGRGMLEQILYGARISLLIGVAAALLAGLAGTVVGVTAGWLGGRSETFIMRVADVQLSFPSILIAVFLAAFVPPSILAVIAVLAITRWAQIARLARAVTVKARQQSYVEAALTLGFPVPKVIWSCILPNLVAPLIIVLTAELSLIILAESALGYLGLGTPPTVPSWGRIIANGKNYLDNAWWISTLPGLGIGFVVIAIGLTGDWMRRVLSRGGFEVN
jgi:peptide/nickel transport system permease protein